MYISYFLFKLVMYVCVLFFSVKGLIEGVNRCKVRGRVLLGVNQFFTHMKVQITFTYISVCVKPEHQGVVALVWKGQPFKTTGLDRSLRYPTEVSFTLEEVISTGFHLTMISLKNFFLEFVTDLGIKRVVSRTSS